MEIVCDHLTFRVVVGSDDVVGRLMNLPLVWFPFLLAFPETECDSRA